MSDLIFNWAVLVLNCMTALSIILMLVLHKRMRVFPVSHKVGLWLGATGLLGQAYRNLIFLTAGNSPSDNELPFWVLKDAGYWVVLLGVVFLIIKKRIAK